MKSVKFTSSIFSFHLVYQHFGIALWLDFKANPS